MILLADDNPDDVLLLRCAFESAGINEEIVDVPNGQQVIDYLLGERKFADRSLYPIPILLLLDLHMSPKSGFDVLAWLKEREAFRDLAVVVFCTSLFEADLIRARELGASEYVEKCGDPRRLISLVSRLAERYLERPVAV